MIKNVCCISDTDSAIVCLDGWYRFVLDLLNKNNVNNTAAFVKIILLINLIVNFIISCLLIFGYYINNSGVIIIS